MSSMTAINFPTFPPTKKVSSPTQKPNFLALHPSACSSTSSQIAKTLNPLITLCSTKPDTQNDNTTDGNPNSSLEFQSNSSGLQQNQPRPTSEQPPSSTPTPSSKGLIFDLGPSESWDSIEIGSPVVKRFLSDDQERWFMWYYGRSGSKPGLDSIGLAVSSNGVRWQRGEEAASQSGSTPGLVMSCGEDWWAFDTVSIRPSEVMVMSSSKVRAASAVYWLYYTGYSSEEVELPQGLSLQFDLSNPERAQYGGESRFGRVFKSLPGLAISQDGRNWARIEGDHHSGALFDVGSNGEWDSLFIASPHVVFHAAGDLRMYYHSFDLQEKKFSIGIARSRDGIKWVKLGKIIGGGSTKGCFDEMGVVNACVLRDKKVGNYLMAYEGVAEDGKRSIGLAVSSDGLKDWKRVSEEPVLVASLEGGWDSKGVGCPCLVQMEQNDDQWRLYYRGVGMEGRTGIGLAFSQGSQVTSFKRWIGFHL